MVRNYKTYKGQRDGQVQQNSWTELGQKVRGVLGGSEEEVEVPVSIVASDGYNIKCINLYFFACKESINEPQRYPILGHACTSHVHAHSYTHTQPSTRKSTFAQRVQYLSDKRRWKEQAGGEAGEQQAKATVLLTNRNDYPQNRNCDVVTYEVVITRS